MYRHFAFLGPESVRAAQASECAGAQDHFWEYHDTLFEHWAGENQGAFSDPNLKSMARELGLDAPAFDRCLDNSTYARLVADERDRALGLNVRTTPTVFINGRRIEGLQDYADYRRMVETALAAAQ